jgi:hypothetical protein
MHAVPRLLLRPPHPPSVTVPRAIKTPEEPDVSPASTVNSQDNVDPNFEKSLLGSPWWHGTN